MSATMSEAVQQWAYVIGINRQYTQWLLSDYDSWERNPHYVGPDQGHPETGDPLCAVFGTFKEADRAAKYYAPALAKPLRVEHYKDTCWVVWF
jgi:hypothetical protein